MSLPGFPEAAPLEGFAGGVLIGLAAALMLLGLGRIAGISGIAARAVGISTGGMGRGAAWLFLLGLPLGAAIVTMLSGAAEVRFASPVMLGIAGLLVGFGTRLGSGCTSGHGVCGISRLSQRSIIATCCFMASGIATVAAMRWLGLEVLP